MVAGLLLKANEARIVTLSGTRASHSLVAEKLNKLAVAKNPTREDVAAFVQALQAFCAANKIEKLVLNRRATAGQGAGGAGTFLLEGVLLACSPVPVDFAHPATMKATDRKAGDSKAQKPTTIDLGKAYDLAYEGLL
ncbi:DUF3010 family protein [Pseudomonas turukhanskensis]|uniref:DUF3010 family protein n=1 Tax=Pseudomonas turukhanskensis TaxID=1806536 RepID=UPI0022F2F778|nr:DUF3010 family protein [Pseudomonas turukhanskensis]